MCVFFLLYRVKGVLLRGFIYRGCETVKFILPIFFKVENLNYKKRWDIKFFNFLFFFVGEGYIMSKFKK